MHQQLLFINISHICNKKDPSLIPHVHFEISVLCHANTNFDQFEQYSKNDPIHSKLTKLNLFAFRSRLHTFQEPSRLHFKFLVSYTFANNKSRTTMICNACDILITLDRKFKPIIRQVQIFPSCQHQIFSNSTTINREGQACSVMRVLMDSQ